LTWTGWQERVHAIILPKQPMRFRQFGDLLRVVIPFCLKKRKTFLKGKVNGGMSMGRAREHFGEEQIGQCDALNSGIFITEFLFLGKSEK